MEDDDVDQIGGLEDVEDFDDLVDIDAAARDENEAVGDGDLLHGLELENDPTVAPGLCLLQWRDFVALHYMRTDLIAGLGGATSALVCAESLLVHVVRSMLHEMRLGDLGLREANSTDVEDDSRSLLLRACGQSLSIFFECEKILLDLASVGTYFKIVFFDAFSSHYQDSDLEDGTSTACFWALRNAFYLHCCRYCPSIVLHFKSWLDNDYARYIREWQPAFLLCTDLDLPDLEKEWAQGGVDAADAVDTTASVDVDIIPQQLSLMNACLSMELCVALLTGMERRGRRCYVYALAAGFSLNRAAEALARKRIEALKENQDAPQQDAVEAAEQAIASCGAAHEGANGVHLSSVLVAAFLTEYCNDAEEGEPGSPSGSDLQERLGSRGTLQLMALLCKVLLLQPHFLSSITVEDRITLTERAFNVANQWAVWSAIEEMLVGTFMDYAATITSAIAQLPQEISHKILSESFAEMIDTRVLCIALFEALKASQDEPSGIVNLAELFGLQQEEALAEEWRQVAPPDLQSRASERSSSSPLIVDLSFLRDIAQVKHVQLPRRLRGEAQHSDKASSFLDLPTPFPLLAADNTVIRRVVENSLGAMKGVMEASDTTNDPIPRRQNLYKNNPTWPHDPNLVDPLVELELELRRRADAYDDETRKKLQQRYKDKSQTLIDAMMKKIKLKTAQKGSRTLRAYAASLMGTDKLHHPVVQRRDELLIMDGAEDGPGAAGSTKGAKAKKTKEPKLSKKAAEIIEKSEQEQKKKRKEADSNQLKVHEETLDIIAACADPSELTNQVLNLVAGRQRTLHALNDFPYIRRILKLPESQCYLLVKIAKAMRSALLSMRIAAIDTDTKRVKLRSAICLAFRLVDETFSNYKEMIDGKQIQILQELLLLFGMKSTAKKLFEEWKACQEKLASGHEDASAAGPAQKKDAKKSEKSSKKEKTAKASSGKEKAGDSTGKDSAEWDQFRVKKAKEVMDFVVPEEQEITFQLLYMGADLEKTTGTTFDTRVNFRPDAWQRRVLDVVDMSHSALVCAPTSSGKTFICYYAMEKVLRSDSDSVAVYISPSKALVNQVQAEVVARFSSKNFPALSTRVLQGKFEKDFAERPWDCQVLITTPQILEAILMSSEYRSWVHRLRYVILDEIHCIGRAEGGESWERLVQLIPCPFLAFSATVGNPIAFYEWLKRAHTVSPISLVVHTERFSDLYKYTYSDGKVMPLHPATCLRYSQVLEEGLPQDFYLSPRETLQMFWTTRTYMRGEESRKRLAPPSSVEEKANGAASKLDSTTEDQFFDWLEPKCYFSNTRAVTKKQFRFWMNTFKIVFLQALREKIVSCEVFEKVVNSMANLSPVASAGESTLFDIDIVEREGLLKLSQLRGTKSPSAQENAEVVCNGTESHFGGQESVKTRDDTTIVGGGAGTTVVAGDSQPLTHLNSNIRRRTYLNPLLLLKFVRRLEQLDMLPTIIFNFSRSEICAMLVRLVQHLEKGQHDKFFGDEERAFQTRQINKARQERYEARLAELEMNEKLKGMTRQQRLEQGGDGEYDERLAGEAGAIPLPQDVSQEFDPEFNLANRSALRLNQDTIDDQIRKVEYIRRSVPSPELLAQGLKRGIGIHHEGLPKKYRQAVEVLFRMGYLRVVVATGSLALGINMPCRSACFAGDSFELTPLMFRQMSGRAGRRGFDNLGHVLFIDVPQAKVKRLLGAKLGMLEGDYPASCSLLTRCFSLREVLTHKADSEFAFLQQSYGHAPLLAVHNKRGDTVVTRPRTKNEYIDFVDDGLQKIFAQPLCSVVKTEEEAMRLVASSSHQPAGAASDARVVDEQSRLRRLMVGHSSRLLVDLLRRNCCLTPQCHSIGLAIMLSYTHKNDPGNVVFAQLLMRGVVHEYLESVQERELRSMKRIAPTASNASSSHIVTASDTKAQEKLERSIDSALLALLAILIHQKRLHPSYLPSFTRHHPSGGSKEASPTEQPSPTTPSGLDATLSTRDRIGRSFPVFNRDWFPTIPPPPLSIIRAIDSCNKEMLRNAAVWLRSATESAGLSSHDETGVVLPFSTQRLSSMPPQATANPTCKLLLQGEDSSRWSVSCYQSPLGVLSSIGRPQSSMTALTRISRSELQLDATMLPTIDLPLLWLECLSRKNTDFNPTPQDLKREPSGLLNSWILDFHTHGRIFHLKHNGLGADLWFYLSDFVESIAGFETVVTRTLHSPKSDIVAASLTRLRRDLSEALQKEGA